ncbi:MAG: glycine--tRNA ligase subunit beta [Rhizobiales bacterium NRL2]|jgi:glycyl-tRNA synthetase beta chain|nr:MAG: glycine--tRNA ligase subunit beta [Rhizobiales bacterium NRL2]
MTELLLELFSEEIPARMQDRAAADLARLLNDALTEAGLQVSKPVHHSTPRRLTVVFEEVPEATADVREERKGPKADAPEKAINGFLGSVGLTRDQIEERETPKGTFLFAVIEKPGQPTAEILPGLIEGAIQKLPWPKSMRWGAHQVGWVRPLHSILCLFGGAVVPVSYGPVTSRDTTRGHRFHAPEEFAVTDFADYRAKLREAKVVLDREERKRIIQAGATALVAAENVNLIQDDGLLDEVAGLVEWPVPLMGRIDDAFMDVPQEVLITSMRSHQKYFSTLNPDGSLAPYFVAVANLEAGDGGQAIVAGNEKVLRARLSDAKFFWDKDRERSLESRVSDLDPIVFHAAMGSMRRKAERLATLAAWIAPRLGADAMTAHRAGLLAKADLTTEMVGEFPELQGFMGRYYARHDGEPEAVADAIRWHYSPAGPGDLCPSDPVSVAVALADKLDTLAGFFGIGEKPTGSKDPYALRRAALGVIRLILENGLRIGLREAFVTAHSAVAEDFTQTQAATPRQVAIELLDFIADRLKVTLREQGVRHDLITAVFALGGEDDLVRLTRQVEALQRLVESEDGGNLLAAYRRAANILRIEEKKDGAVHTGPADRGAFVEAAETELGEALAAALEKADAALAAEDFGRAMSAMAALRGPVDAFFDNVTVNAEDAALRANRLKLLAEIRATLHRVADFSKIEG